MCRGGTWAQSAPMNQCPSLSFGVWRRLVARIRETVAFATVPVGKPQDCARSPQRLKRAARRATGCVGTDPAQSATGERADADALPGVGAAQHLDKRSDDIVGLGIDNEA